MFFIRVILLPIAFLFGIVTKTRNLLFDIGILKSKKYKTKSISVGNITVGGTGKSPHIEYLIRLLYKNHKIAILSRGYQRNTKGYVVANKDSTYKDIGDEPMQFHSKFDSITVVVDEDRQRGIENIEKEIQPDVILLDDCYQHRWVEPQINILLIDYSTIGKKQFMLPSGELREWKSGKKRANIIVITKSPKLHSPIEHRRISSLIQPLKAQNIFFSYINYNNLKPFNFRAEALFKDGIKLDNFKTLVFAGIAKITPLIDYLKQESKEVFVTEFKDHQNFEPINMVRIVKKFNEIIGAKKIIITTEKDAMRLHDPRLFPLLEDVPVFFLPIDIKFHKGLEEETTFDKTILDYVQ